MSWSWIGKRVDPPAADRTPFASVRGGKTWFGYERTAAARSVLLGQFFELTRDQIHENTRAGDGHRYVGRGRHRRSQLDPRSRNRISQSTVRPRRRKTHGAQNALLVQCGIYKDKARACRMNEHTQQNSYAAQPAYQSCAPSSADSSVVPVAQPVSADAMSPDFVCVVDVMSAFSRIPRN